jgi:hypothetical protein
MIVEITNEGEYYNIWIGNKKVRNIRANLNSFAFYDDDIENLIGENNYKKAFQDGKFIFEVSKKHLDLISGERSAQTKAELLMYNY